MSAGAADAAKVGYDLWSSYQQAEIVRANGKLAKQIASFNAGQAELDAWQAEKDGYTQSARYASVVNKVKAEQEAAMAAQNIDSSFGTAAEVVKETNITAFLNTQDIINQAHARALGYKREARNIRLQGAMGQITTSTNAQAIQNAALIRAGGTLAGYGLNSPSKPEATQISGSGGSSDSYSGNSGTGYRMGSGL